MRETKFIEQNQEKWRQFERSLSGHSANTADQLNELFVHITDDLSYSRTFYPNRSVRVYLNGLAQRIFLSIYRQRRSQWGRLLNFWIHQLPQLLYEARRDLLLSFATFALAAAIGVISSYTDARFAEIILGETYVEMTLANIEADDPMAVYKQMGPLGMTAGITLNNLFVAVFTFVMGVFFSVGSMVFLVRNGIMLGTFQYFFIERGLFWDSFLTIWMHGTMEIAAIILAGAAGITMGRGLVFPGTYPRRYAFQRSARRGMKILVGIIPLFLFAGFVEGFITRYTELSYFLRGSFIFICLVFILLYFVWYPYYRHRIMGSSNISDAEPQVPARNNISYHSIKSNGLIFTDVLSFLKNHFGKLFPWAALLAAGYTVVAFTTAGSPAADLFYYPNTDFTLLFCIDPLLTGTVPSGMWIFNGCAFAILAYITYHLIEQQAPALSQEAWPYRWLVCLLGGFITAAIFNQDSWIGLLLFCFCLSIVLLWTYIMYREKRPPLDGIGRTAGLLRSGYWSSASLLLITFLSGLLFASLADTIIGRFFFELIGWIVNFEQTTMDAISVITLTFLYVFLLYGVIIMSLVAFAFFYYSQLEIHEARHLRAQLKDFGNSRQIRGMLRE